MAMTGCMVAARMTYSTAAMAMTGCSAIAALIESMGGVVTKTLLAAPAVIAFSVVTGMTGFRVGRIVTGYLLVKVLILFMAAAVLTKLSWALVVQL